MMMLDDEQFIHACFKIILGREADPNGFAHYLDLLKKKKNRSQVISDLCYSPEVTESLLPFEILAAVRRYRSSRLFRLSLKRRVPKPQPATPLEGQPAGASLGPDARREHAHAEQVRLNEALLERLGALQQDVSHLQYSVANASRAPKDILGDGTMRYLFNLSTSNHWRRHAVGIVRVERELGKYLSRFGNIDFVIWDSHGRSLKTLLPYQVSKILSDEWCANGSVGQSFPGAQLSEAAIKAGDIYISVGLDWDHAPTGQLVEYLARFGAKAVLACYDTVPVQFPEFLVRDELGQEFRQHLVEMGHGASEVMAISQSTKRDLVHFWEEAGLERRLPDVFTISLASYASPSQLPVLNAHEHQILRDVFGRGDYILYVSSVESRKNHKMVFDIWRDLWLERGVDCPQFVHVGMAGWGNTDLLGRVPRMPAYIGGKINWLQHVSDDLLAHLYHNCAFTIFPSLYEGWGLAATESLAFGKVCVVSNNSSLEEATQGLMPRYHPLDFIGWKREIERLLDDDGYRKSLEQKISDEHRSVSWADFGARFCDQLVLGKN